MKTRTQVIILAVLLFLFIGLIVSGYFKTEKAKKPILNEKNDPKFLYDFYFSTTPNIEGRPWYGEAHAPITLIVYSNLRSSGVEYFMNNIIPQLKEEYIHTGKMRLYHKYYFTMQDKTDQTENYIIAKTLECFRTQHQDQYFDFYFDLYNTSTDTLPLLLGKYDVDWNDYKECMNQQAFKELDEDMSEVENFGIIGIIPRIYIGIEGQDLTVVDGVPSYQRLKTIIRRYEIQLGE